MKHTIIKKSIAGNWLSILYLSKFISIISYQVEEFFVVMTIDFMENLQWCTALSSIFLVDFQMNISCMDSSYGSKFWVAIFVSPYVESHRNQRLWLRKCVHLESSRYNYAMHWFGESQFYPCIFWECLSIEHTATFCFGLQYTQVLYSEAVCVLFSINKQCLRFFFKNFFCFVHSIDSRTTKKKSLELRCDLFENSKMVWQENIEMPIYNRSYHMCIDGGWNVVCPTNKFLAKMTGKKSFVIQIICGFFIYFVHTFNRRTC